ncbi:MAG: S8 family serine peptidase [Phycisphaerales bacterium]|nr:MAG: S8 family serine peptidase [Phycisphaerales bacterium]
MFKRIFLFLMCWVSAVNDTYARFPDRSQADSYIVVLKEPSLSRIMLDRRGRSMYKGIATRPNLHAERMSRRRMRMEERLGQFENRLKSLSPRIVPRRRFTGLLNGVSLDMPRGMASRIRSMPEVLSIVPNRRYDLSLTRSNNLMNAPLAWQLAGGQELAGQGIKIGIIDTGIDHTHVMFDDAEFELPQGYPLGDTDFTNKKVIVARVLTKSGDSPEDSTPRDRNGHGTHVASCAAGNSNTLSPLGSISGLAPRAHLGNYKVFTGEFTTLEQIVAALEACVEDGMDVVNLSLGAEAYINTVLDPEALAIRNAIKAGVVVVAAAGNSGRSETIGSPGQIPEVITVGSLTNSHNGSRSGEIDIAMMNVYSDDRLIVADEQVVLGPDPDFFSRPLLGRFQIVDADTIDGGRYGGDSTGIVCRSLPVGSAQDKWVLVQRGTCEFTEKVGHVQQAGGWGALIYNKDGAEGGPDAPLRNPGVRGTQLPSYFISRNTGLAIKSALVEAGIVEVEFNAAVPAERDLTPFALSSFSSVGPSLDYGIKPEIAAIGEGSYAATQNDWPGEFDLNIFEYSSFDLSGFSFSSGTSFSAPRVAGVAALVKQANPAWKPEDVKSAIVTCAERLPSLVPLSVMERGGGHVDTARAMSLPLIATPASISWENVLIDDVTELGRSLRLRNVTDELQAISLSLALSADDRAQVVEVFPEQFDLAPQDSIDISLNIRFSPPPGGLGAVEDIDGDVVIEIAGEPDLLRVPMWARIINAPPVQGSVLLIDDDSGETIENQYVGSIGLAGYEATVWDVAKLKAYPSVEYMQRFQASVWFLATTSLFNIRQNKTLSSNERIRFNVALTKYLARGGRLLVSGMDWSDGQEQTLFGQQVLHISQFVHDPFVQYTLDGDVASQERILDISTAVGSPIGLNLPDLDASFDSDVANMSDVLVPDASGTAQPALMTNNNPEDVIGITVETDSYRAVFFSFPLERVLRVPRLSRDGMDIIIQNSLDWLMSGSRKLLSIQSIEPGVQIDNSIPTTVTLTVEGINFSVGHDVRLNEQSVEITAIDMSGRIEILVPAGLPQGLYDITLDSPDGQSDVLPAAFAIGDPTQPLNAL